MNAILDLACPTGRMRLRAHLQCQGIQVTGEAALLCYDVAPQIPAITGTA